MRWEFQEPRSWGHSLGDTTQQKLPPGSQNPRGLRGVGGGRDESVRGAAAGGRERERERNILAALSSCSLISCQCFLLAKPRQKPVD